MSQPESQYTSTKARTLHGLKDAATKSTAKATMDSLFQPLLEIPLQHIIITPPIQKFFFYVLLRNIGFVVIFSSTVYASLHVAVTKQDGDLSTWECSSNNGICLLVNVYHTCFIHDIGYVGS